MALADYVNQSLDKLLNGYVSEINRLKGLTTDDLAKESLDGDIKTYSEIIGGMKEVSHQFEGQLDPKVNNDLGYKLENFVSKALKDNDNPSQLYRIISDKYHQEIFNDPDSLIILLSKIYWEALKILGNPDPITGQKYYNVSREARENAAKIKGIVEELLGEALYRHWLSMGKKITKGEVMANLAQYARPFYGAWEGVKGKIEKEVERLTPNVEVQNAVEMLLMELENSYLSFIQGSIIAAYNKRSAPEHIIPVLRYLSGKGFFKNVFNEMYNEIGNYINQLQPQIAQYLQLNQPVGQQQGQPGNQPNPQSPQQNPQPQNPVVQVPLPQRIMPQNQQQNQQNNQQGKQTP
jgi:hypothetical protein